MAETYDAIVAGAGVNGASNALHLAKLTRTYGIGSIS